jgi:hypothetical protein
MSTATDVLPSSQPCEDVQSVAALVTDVRQIPLTRGKVALVDATDCERVAAHEWYAEQRYGHPSWYAVRDVTTAKGQRQTIALHRVLLRAPAGVRVCFRNGDTLDCRRANLKLVRPKVKRKPAAPARVERTAPPKVPRQRGVTAHASGRWAARIQVDGERLSLGLHETRREAAIAYNAAARVLHRQAAILNEIPPAASRPSPGVLAAQCPGAGWEAGPGRGTEAEGVQGHCAPESLAGASRGVDRPSTAARIQPHFSACTSPVVMPRTSQIPTTQEPLQEDKHV